MFRNSYTPRQSLKIVGFGQVSLQLWIWQQITRFYKNFCLNLIHAVFFRFFIGKAIKIKCIKDLSLMVVLKKWRANEGWSWSILDLLKLPYCPIFSLFHDKYWLCTLMPVYHCNKPVLWSKWPLASSLLQAIKTCRQACPPGYLMHFS